VAASDKCYTMRCFPCHFLLVVPLLLAGCDALGLGHKKGPPPREFTLVSPYNTTRTYAVAPFLNLSGSHDFDPLTMSDQLFSELQQIQNLNVLPVNKTLAAMAQLHLRTINSPQAAQKVADLIGADALLVPAITAFDPYNPPTVGMAFQLYTQDDLAGPPPAGTRQINGAMLPDPNVHPSQPATEIAAIFNSTNQTVLMELHDFTKGRTDYQSALQEQRYLADIDSYARFVCHAMVRRLMDVERVRATGR